MMGRVDGKVALVSGGVRGMGAADARLLVAEGARVVIGDLLDEEGTTLAKELGAAAAYVHLDVSREVPRRWCIPSLQGATGCHAGAHVR